MITQEEAAKARETIARAIALLKEHGWIQGEMGSKKTGFCLLGALKEAGDENRVAYRIVRERLGMQLKDYNDMRRKVCRDGSSFGTDRRKEEVIAVLESCIDEKKCNELVGAINARTGFLDVETKGTK